MGTYRLTSCLLKYFSAPSLSDRMNFRLRNWPLSLPRFQRNPSLYPAWQQKKKKEMVVRLTNNSLLMSWGQMTEVWFQQFAMERWENINSFCFYIDNKIKRETIKKIIALQFFFFIPKGLMVNLFTFFACFFFCFVLTSLLVTQTYLFLLYWIVFVVYWETIGKVESGFILLIELSLLEKK